MNLRDIKSAMNHYGVSVGDEIKNHLFSSDRGSAKKLRDSLVHSMTKKNLETMNRQYPQLMADIELFLNAVTEH